MTASQRQQLTTYDEWFRDNPEPTRELLAQPNRDQYDKGYGGARDWERALNRWRDEKTAWDDWNYANNIYTRLREEIVNPE